MDREEIKQEFLKSFYKLCTLYKGCKECPLRISCNDIIINLELDEKEK